MKEMKFYISILSLLLWGCSTQSIVQKKTDCPCSVSYILSYEKIDLRAVCYVPYRKTYRSGVSEFYEFEITDCKGGGTVRKLNNKGEVVKIREYVSTDSIQMGYSTSMFGNGTDRTKTITYYPKLIKSE